MARRSKEVPVDQLDMFAPNIPPPPPKPPILEVAPEPPPAAPEPVRAALPESMRIDVVVDDVEPVSSVVHEAQVPSIAGIKVVSAEAELALAIARWEVLIYLWEGGRGGVCAPYRGVVPGDIPWKARWMSTADAERVLEMSRYTRHCFHEGPLPNNGSTRKAQVWRRPDVDQRAFAKPLAVVAVELEVPDMLDDLAKVRRSPIP